MNMLPDADGFRAFQTGFAARIRNPQGAPLPTGVSERRMRVYEELVFENLEGFLLACYPITHRILGDKGWAWLLRRFMIEHRCESPLFRDIPKEFLDWAGLKVHEYFPGLPFLHEFLHYEWLELSVSISPEKNDPANIDSEGDFLASRPALNATTRLACYNFPVHRIGPGFQPRQARNERYCYLLHRDAGDQVQFILLSPVSARLVELLQQEKITGREALLQLARELNNTDLETVFEAGRKQLEALHRAGVLLGTWRCL
jgi:hypothetical protein